MSGLVAVVAIVGIWLVPRRWLFLVLVLAANVDTSPAVNTVKHLVVPGVFAWRAGWRPRWVPTRIALPAVTLVGLFAAGAVQSEHPLEAVKLVVYFGDAWLLVGGFRALRARGLLELRALRHGLWLALGLGVLAQVSGATSDEVGRFTSWMTAQNYAFLLVVLTLTIAVAAHNTGVRLPRLVLAAGAAGVFASGSRTGAAALVVGAAAGLVWVAAHSRRTRAFRTVALLAGLAVLAPVTISAAMETDARVTEGLQAIRGGQVGTFDFRAKVYSHAINTMRHEDPLTLLVGHGTSNGGQLVTDAGVYRPAGFSEDPNRTVHNEYLRTSYEVGLLGLGAFVAVIAAVWRKSRRVRERLFAATLGLPVLLFLATENVFAAGETGAGFGIALVVALASTRRAPATRPGPRSQAVTRTS